MAYTTKKISASRVAIFRDGTYLTQLRPAEAKSWIARMEISDKIDAEAAITQRQYRLEAARAYLAKRANRQTARETQLSLF